MPPPTEGRAIKSYGVYGFRTWFILNPRQCVIDYSKDQLQYSTNPPQFYLIKDSDRVHTGSDADTGIRYATPKDMSVNVVVDIWRAGIGSLQYTSYAFDCNRW